MLAMSVKLQKEADDESEEHERRKIGSEECRDSHVCMGRGCRAPP